MSSTRGRRTGDAVFAVGLLFAAGATGSPHWKAGPMPPEMSRSARHAMCYDASRQVVVVFGGFIVDATQNNYLSNATFELGAAGWQAGAPPHPALRARQYAAMGYDSVRQRVVLFGGEDSSYRKVADPWEYDGELWVPAAAPPAGLDARLGHAMAFDEARGRMVLFGGTTDTVGLQNDTWEYDGSAWMPRPGAPPGLTPREHHAMAYDAARRVTVLFGGHDSTNADVNDTWEYDGSAWVAGPAAPPGLTPRTGHAMVYDRARGVTVLYGGGVGLTWEYDGTAWSQSPAPQLDPSRRSDHGMAYDGRTGRVVLFGGDLGGSPTNDVYEYDGTSWSAAPAVPVMVKRFALAAAYDSIRGVVVLYGGVADFNPVAGLDIPWEYDGIGWRQGPRSPAAVGERWYAALAFDAGRGQTVLFGGAQYNPPTGYHDDTWLYDGSQWQPGPAAPPGLTARIGSAMAYDAGRALLVLFGGAEPSVARNDTWLDDGSGWVAGPAAPPALTPRNCVPMAYDASRARIVIYGSNSTSDTWELDASGWMPGAAPATGMTERNADGLAYDSGRQVIVLTGGRTFNPSGMTNESWELDASGWTQGAVASPDPPARVDLAFAELPAIGGLVLNGGRVVSGLNDTWLYECLDIAPSALPEATMGLPYAEPLAASGGTAPYTYTVSAGALPSWLSLSPGGLLSGTPTQAGAWPKFRVKAVDASGCSGSELYQVRVVCPGIGISPASLPGATAGTPYSIQLAATGGTAPYAFGLAYGILPPGLALSSAGLLSGTPQAGGSYVFGIGATDGNGCVGRGDYVIVVVCPTISLSPAALPAGEVGQPYATTIGASGGNAPYGFAVTAGTLPPGLALTAAGSFAGTPATAGSYPFDVTATDLLGCSGFASYVVAVDARHASILAGQGLGPPNPNRVRAFDGSGGATGVDFLAYASGQWGVNVTTGSVDPDPFGEILTGPGPGPVLGPQVRGFRGDGTPMGKVNFYAYGTLKYGTNVAAADVDADAMAEIVSGAGAGAVFGPHVRAFDFDGAALAPIAKISFFAYATPRYGVVVGGGDVDGDSFDELVTGPGPSGAFGATVRTFDHDAAGIAPKATWNAYTSRHGLIVVGGDVDADGVDEVLTAPGPGPTNPARYLGFRALGLGVTALPGFDAVRPGLYGGRAATGDLDGDTRAGLLAGSGPDPGAAATVEALAYDGASLTLLPLSVTPFAGGYGVNPGAGPLGP